MEGERQKMDSKEVGVNRKETGNRGEAGKGWRGSRNGQRVNGN